MYKKSFYSEHYALESKSLSLVLKKLTLIIVFKNGTNVLEDLFFPPILIVAVLGYAKSWEGVN